MLIVVNNILSTETVALMKRDKRFHSLRISAGKVTMLIFFVITLGTFRKKAAEDLRVHVRGQKTIRAGYREESKYFVF